MRHSLWVWFWVWFLVWSVGSWRVVLRPSSSSFVRCCCLFFVRVPSSVGCVVFLLLFRLLVPGRSSVACPCWVGVFVVGLGFGCFGFWFGCAVGFAGFLCRHRDLLTIALPPIEWPGYACSNVRQLYSRAVRVERKKGLRLHKLLVPPPEKRVQVVRWVHLAELPQHLRFVAPLEGHHLLYSS